MKNNWLVLCETARACEPKVCLSNLLGTWLVVIVAEKVSDLCCINCTCKELHIMWLVSSNLQLHIYHQKFFYLKFTEVPFVTSCIRVIQGLCGHAV
jgi:hypothetical protein